MASLPMDLAAAASRLVPHAVVGHVFTHPPRRRPGVPWWVRRGYDVHTSGDEACPVHSVSPRGAAADDVRRELVYLHGGAYTLQDFHWGFLTRFVKRGWTVHLVDYPLAPEHTVDETVPEVLAAWLALRARTTGPLHLAGDSAGGGLSLVLLQQLRDAGLPLPDGTVLLSPWVDLVLDDEETLAEAASDPVLPLAGLRGAARLYAGERPLDDPLLSPLLGDLSGLGRGQAWVGTREQFGPQCHRLADRAAEADGTDLTLHVVEGGVHDWVLVPVPEQGRTIEAMLAFWDEVAPDPPAPA